VVLGMALRFGQIEVDLDAFEVRRSGEAVHVEPQVFDVLRYLVEHRDRLVLKEELIEEVWGTRFVSESALTSRIKAARRALGDDGREQRMIRTVHGRGYRFIGAPEGEGPAGNPRPAVRRPAEASPLLEREEALDVLHGAIADAGAGHGRVVLVAGEAGIGKTALVRTLAAGDVRVVVGACDDLVTPRPLGAVHDLAEGLPGLAEPLARPGAGDLQRALLDELKREPAPLVVVVEDAHWADEATIDLLTGVTRRIADVPAVIVLTFRPDEVVGAHPLVPLLGGVPSAAARHIDLRPLSSAAVAELVGSERAGEVMATTGGVPFFVAEVAAMAPSNDGAGLPASVAHAVRARVARLPERTGSLLDLLSVEPTRTDLAVLDALRPAWAEELEPAERAAMVVVAGRAVAFRHELARRAVHDALPSGRRRALHREVAGHLASTGADPSRVVHHAEAAGEDELLVQHALLAAERASAVAAHREAWSHYQRAVPLLGLVDEQSHAPILEAASREAYAADDATAGLALGLRSLAEWRRLGDTLAIGRVHRWLSRLHYFLGRRVESEVQAQLAVRVLEALPPSVELAWAYSNLSQLAMLAWRAEEAVRWGERAIALARELDDVEVLVHAMVNVGAGRLNDNIGDDGPLRDAIERAQQAGIHHEATRGMIAIAYTLLLADLPAPSGEVARRAIDYAEEFDVEALRRYLVAILGRVAVLEGRWDEAKAILDGVVASAPSITLIFGLASLALLQVRRGDEGAAATLERGWPLAEAAAEPQRIIPFVEVEAEWAWLAGALTPEVRHLRDAYAMARPLDAQRARLARWLQEAGGLDEVPVVRSEPHRAELEGRWADAASAWAARGLPYERAKALARTGAAGRAEAIGIARRLGARPLLAALELERSSR
jgi:DNA-binding winged helix-turn-helix (wHTH) protein